MVHTSVAVSEVTTELAIETDETRNSNAGRLAGWNGRAIPEAIGAQARTLGNGEENRQERRRIHRMALVRRVSVF